MCGIAGIFRYSSQRPVRSGELAAMGDLLRHRGPDDHGIYTDGCLGLAHTRLTILDTSSRGRGPMSDAGGALVITYNGEIYNYLELRAELAAQGYQFRTTTDTEVVLALYERDGDSCVHRLNGMFAFALWDRRRRRLLLARDRVGVKPLYLARTAEGLLFASEIGPLLQALPQRPSMDRGGLDAYMSVGYVPGERTLLTGITKLLPGWTLSVDAQGERATQYWDMPLEPSSESDGASDGEWIERIRELLFDAVRLELRSDVPLGVLLSGGVDSGAVLSLTHRLGHRDLDAYTVAYDCGHEYDESGAAADLARLLGARHHLLYVTPREFADSVPELVRRLEEPVTEAAALSLLHLSRLASRRVKVVLSGEGADEVFGGYPIYGRMLALEQYRRLPAVVRRRALDPLLAALGPKWRKYVRLGRLPLARRYVGVSLQDPEESDPLLRPELRVEDGGFAEQIASLYERTEGLHPLRRMMYLDLKTWLPDDLLIKADKMTMAAGLELRVPFLDHRLVELGARHPPHLRLRRGRTKHGFKEALSGIVPAATLARPKMGFPTPLGGLLRGALRDRLRARLDGDDPFARECFDTLAVRRLVHEHLEGRRDHHLRLWQLLVLCEWHHAMIDGAPPVGALAEAG